MNEDYNPIEIIQIIPKIVQALYSDGVLYFSNEILISDNMRKEILLKDINLIKDQISKLEKILI